jgi:hypothetical protein
LGRFSKASLPAGFGDGDLVDARRVVPVVRPGDDGLAGVGEHARKLVERAQLVVHVADRAQRFAEVDVGQGVDNAGHRGTSDFTYGRRSSVSTSMKLGRSGRAKVRAARADVDVVLRVAVARPQGEAARGLGQRVFDQPGGDAHALALHPGAGLLQNLARFFVLHVQAGVLQHVEHAVEQLLELVLGEQLEAHAGIDLVVCSHGVASPYVLGGDRGPGIPRSN